MNTPTPYLDNIRRYPHANNIVLLLYRPFTLIYARKRTGNSEITMHVIVDSSDNVKIIRLSMSSGWHLEDGKKINPRTHGCMSGEDNANFLSKDIEIYGCI